MNWTDIIQNLGLFTIATGFISWLLKRLGEYFMDKRFKSFEAELQIKSEEYRLELDKRLETYKSDLSLQQLKKERLHNKRSEILEELYKRIVTLDFAMKELTAVFKQIKSDYDKEEQERINKSGNAYNEFLIYFKTHKLYFTEQTNKILDDLTAKYFDTLWDHTYEKRMRVSDPQVAKDAYKRMQEEIPKVLADIELDFKKYLE
ncbi:MAG: hypothetical protein KF856_17445 [Cyclobacteriaceae bacterium]|nr:hypothetical protein [Cyclobacteriaceae bacterium]